MLFRRSSLVEYYAPFADLVSSSGRVLVVCNVGGVQVTEVTDLEYGDTRRGVGGCGDVPASNVRMRRYGRATVGRNPELSKGFGEAGIQKQKELNHAPANVAEGMVRRVQAVILALISGAVVTMLQRSTRPRYDDIFDMKSCQHVPQLNTFLIPASI